MTNATETTLKEIVLAELKNAGYSDVKAVKKSTIEGRKGLYLSGFDFITIPGAEYQIPKKSRERYDFCITFKSVPEGVIALMTQAIPNTVAAGCNLYVRHETLEQMQAALPHFIKATTEFMAATIRYTNNLDAIVARYKSH